MADDYHVLPLSIRLNHFVVHTPSLLHLNFTSTVTVMRFLARAQDLLLLMIFVMMMTAMSFHSSTYHKLRLRSDNHCIDKRVSSLSMNVVEDAFRFFTNLNKEASAKHILIRGPSATEKLLKIKEEIESADDISIAFSEIASKVSFRMIPKNCSYVVDLVLRSVNVHQLPEVEI